VERLRPVQDRPVLFAFVVLIACFVAGAILLALDFVLIGIIVALVGIPAAFVAWMTAGERY
jgi:hypothetical protein